MVEIRNTSDPDKRRPAIITRLRTACGWRAAGIKGGQVVGANGRLGPSTSPKTKVHVHDLQATTMQCLGFDSYPASPTGPYGTGFPATPERSRERGVKKMLV